MGQETDADNLCEVTDNQQPPRLPYTYTILFVGWVLGLLFTYAITSLAPSIYYLTTPIIPLYLVFFPPACFFLCLLTYIQYLFIKELDMPTTNCRQSLKRSLFGAFCLAFVYLILLANEQLSLVVVNFSPTVVLDGDIDISEDYFWVSKELNILVILSLGFILGLIIFSFFRYPYALVIFSLCIIAPSYKFMISLVEGINYEASRFIPEHGIGIYFTFVPMGFGIGLILIGIRAIFASRKSSKLENTINDTKIIGTIE